MDPFIEYKGLSFAGSMGNFRVHRGDGTIIMYFKVLKKDFSSLNIECSVNDGVWVDLGSFMHTKIYDSNLEFLVEKIDEIKHPIINALFRDSKIDDIISDT